MLISLRCCLENGGEKENVSVLKNPGGGVAPWNICQYSLDNINDDQIMLRDKRTGRTFPLIFYHFHNIHYYSRNKVYIAVYEVWHTDRKLIETIYYPYLRAIDSLREEIKERFGWKPRAITGQNEKNKESRLKPAAKMILNFLSFLTLIHLFDCQTG